MLKIERIRKDHDRKAFDCGNQVLNEFLQKHARQHADREISRTFVCIDDEMPSKVLGCYTLAACEIIPADIPDARLKRYPHPMPAAKLARLAVNTGNQRMGIGEKLLLNGMERVLRISESVGLVGMFVDAKNTEASNYYQQYGFISTESNQLLLYLPIATIRQAFK